MHPYKHTCMQNKTHETLLLSQNPKHQNYIDGLEILRIQSTESLLLLLKITVLYLEMF